MLDEAISHLESKRKNNASPFSYEIIVVDDGSRDTTSAVSINFMKKSLLSIVDEEKRLREVRTLTLSGNRGKGGAVIQVRE